jgi:hypothetical protein
VVGPALRGGGGCASRRRHCVSCQPQLVAPSNAALRGSRHLCRRRGRPAPPFAAPAAMGAPCPGPSPARPHVPPRDAAMRCPGEGEPGAPRHRRRRRRRLAAPAPPGPAAPPAVMGEDPPAPCPTALRRHGPSPRRARTPPHSPLRSAPRGARRGRVRAEPPPPPLRVAPAAMVGVNLETGPDRPVPSNDALCASAPCSRRRRSTAAAAATNPTPLRARSAAIRPIPPHWRAVVASPRR